MAAGRRLETHGFFRWLFEDDISNAMCGKTILGSLRTDRQEATGVLAAVR